VILAFAQKQSQNIYLDEQEVSHFAHFAAEVVALNILL